MLSSPLAHTLSSAGVRNFIRGLFLVAAIAFLRSTAVEV